MPGVLDADTHIAESEAMWSFIDKEMYPRRPVLARNRRRSPPSQGRFNRPLQLLLRHLSGLLRIALRYPRVTGRSPGRSPDSTVFKRGFRT